MLNLSVAAAEEDIDLESFGKKKKKKKVTIEDDEEGGGEKEDGAVDDDIDLESFGTKKTAFVNFTEIAKMLHRQPKHLLSFLTAELGTPGAAIDGNDQLILKGRFQQKHIENVLRRYIKEFVTCHTCRSPDTILNKETRVWFLQCMTCQSKCSVQTIKTGFQAVTGKRSAKRAKQ